MNNAIQLMSALLPIEFVLSIVAIAVVFVLVKRDLKYWIRLLLVPIFLYGSFFIGMYSYHMLGRPIPAYPSGEFAFIHYRITIAANRQQWIELWVVQKGESRLYVFKYSKKIAKALQKAQKEAIPRLFLRGCFMRICQF